MHTTKPGTSRARPNPSTDKFTVVALKQALAEHSPAQHSPSAPSPAPAPAPAPELCFIRLKEVLAICGKSRTSVYEAIKRGSFPPPVKLGGRSSAWVKGEVLQWVQGCIDASRTN